VCLCRLSDGDRPTAAAAPVLDGDGGERSRNRARAADPRARDEREPAAADHLWLAGSAGAGARLARARPRLTRSSARPCERHLLGGSPAHLAGDGGALWLADFWRA